MDDDGNALARHLALALGALLSTGCTPQASGRLDLPAGTLNAALFDCAESTVGTMDRTDSHWHTRITRRDDAEGRLETGDFAESNVMGYRIRLTRRGDAPQATLDVRAAVPYFTDLGAHEELRAFHTSVAHCLARTPPPR